VFSRFFEGWFASLLTQFVRAVGKMRLASRRRIDEPHFSEAD
jgi:hypothetical protein